MVTLLKRTGNRGMYFAMKCGDTVEYIQKYNRSHTETTEKIQWKTGIETINDK
jgi:glutaredoxin-related protein